MRFRNTSVVRPRRARATIQHSPTCLYRHARTHEHASTRPRSHTRITQYPQRPPTHAYARTHPNRNHVPDTARWAYRRPRLECRDRPELVHRTNTRHDTTRHDPTNASHPRTTPDAPPTGPWICSLVTMTCLKRARVRRLRRSRRRRLEPRSLPESAP